MTRMSNPQKVEKHQEPSLNFFSPEKIFLNVILISMFLTICLRADNSGTQENIITFLPKVYIDYWHGKDKDGVEKNTKLYIQVTPADFTFHKNENGFMAKYHLDILVYNKNKKMVLEKIIADNVLVEKYSMTKSPDQHRLIKIPLNLLKGQYKLLIKVVDDNSDKQTIIKRSIDIKSVEDEFFSLSDILLARTIKIRSQNEPNSEVERITAFPAGIYGINEPNLYYYFEIYKTQDTKTDSIEYRILCRNWKGNETILTQRRQKLTAKKLPVFLKMSTSEMPPGKYKLVVRVNSVNVRKYLEQQKDFYVYQNPFDLHFKSYKYALKEVGLIASKEEMRQLRKAPEPLQQQALNDFWKQRDPTPETVNNEVMEEFYYRLYLAKKLFGQGSSEDISLSDRGKVLVLFGKPDNIFHCKDRVMQVYSEIWLYSHLSLQVVFQDDMGFGKYRLIQPISLLDN